MTYEDAIEWLKGTRSMSNLVPQEPFETWIVRIAQVDAAMTQQAYWLVKAHKEQECLALLMSIMQNKGRNEE